jgi:hypothetical protein
MSDESGKSGPTLREKMELEKARLLEQAERDLARARAIDQKLAKLTEYEQQLAAEFDYGFASRSPNKPEAPVAPAMPEPAPPAAVVRDPVTGIAIGELIDSYLTDPRSPFQELKFQTRHDGQNSFERIKRELGTVHLSSVGKPELEAFYKGWSAGGTKISIGHALMQRLRTAISFGNTVLEDTDCQRLSGIYQTLHIEVPKARVVRLTAEQAIAICSVAREQGMKSIGLAQALQYGTDLRQRDVIGEWVPLDEPKTVSEIMNKKGGKKKWIRGLRWSQIDSSWLLTHEIVARNKTVKVNLTTVPMVMNELGTIDRSKFPTSGPVIMSETTHLPYRTDDFRRKWRMIADLAGVPKTVKNMDNIRSAASDEDEGATESDEDDRQVS